MQNSASGSARRRLSTSRGHRHGRQGSVRVVNPPPELVAASKQDDDAHIGLVASSARGVTYLVGLQVFTRLLTFSLNQCLLRFTNPEVFGLATQLELLATSILFFSREAIRLAMQRQTSIPKPESYRIDGEIEAGTKAGNAQSVTNGGYLSIGLGLLLAPTLTWLYNFRAGHLIYIPYFSASVKIYCLSTLIELFSEPMFELAQYFLQYRLRAACESSAVVARCVVCFTLTITDKGKGGVLSFALGQLAYSLVLTGCYLVFSYRNVRNTEYGILPHKIIHEGGDSSGGPPYSSYFEKRTLILTRTLWLQSVFKHCLTEGDKFLIACFSSISDQGMYALAANYGSLVARMLFFPIEETGRALFSKILAEPVRVSKLESSLRVLTTVVRLYLYLGIICCIFGPLDAKFVLTILAGQRWAQSSAADVLSTYAFYIPLLAVNGILEAFVQSVSTTEQLQGQSLVMLAFSIIYAGSGYLFMRILDLGARGLVIAGMINMSSRIIWCIKRIKQFQADYNKKIVLSASASKNGGSDDKEQNAIKTSHIMSPIYWFGQCIPTRLTLITGLVTGLLALQLGPVESSYIVFASHIALAGIFALSCLYCERKNAPLLLSVSANKAKPNGKSQ